LGLVLSCDLGSTSLRCGLVDDSGAIRRVASAPGPSPVQRSGSDEVDAGDWWGAVCAAVDRLAKAGGPELGEVTAVAVTGVTRTQIFVGRDGRALRRAITWADSRAEALMAELRGRLPAGHPEVPGLSAFHPLARLYWLARHEPEILSATTAVLEPKDYVNARLTGRLATDPISSARLIAAAQRPPDGPSMLEALGIDPAIVPEALAPTAVVGAVQPGLPGTLGRLAGRPVVCVAHDTWASVVGLGALRDGFAYNLSGTTEVLGVLSGTPAHAEGLMSVVWGEGLLQLGGPSQNGADTLLWALELLSGRSIAPQSVGAELDRLLAERRQPEPLVFLPYLQGERTPYWNASLRGAFLGLNRRHRAVDCIHAVLEGVGFLNRIVLERAESPRSAWAAAARRALPGPRSRRTSASARWSSPVARSPACSVAQLPPSPHSASSARWRKGRIAWWPSPGVICRTPPGGRATVVSTTSTAAPRRPWSRSPSHCPAGAARAHDRGFPGRGITRWQCDAEALNPVLIGKACVLTLSGTPLRGEPEMPRQSEMPIEMLEPLPAPPRAG